MLDSSSTPWCQAVHSLNTGLMVICPEGRINHLNDSLKHMLAKYGASPHFEWKGVSIFELSPSLFGRASFDDFFQSAYLPSIRDVMLGINQQYTVEYSIDWIGKTTWVLSEAYPLPLSKGHIAHGIVVSFTNITRYMQRITQFEHALNQAHTLQGHIPICAVCKHVRTEEDWEPVESYLESRMTIEFTHDICPACIRQLYPKYSSILDEP